MKKLAVQSFALLTLLVLLWLTSAIGAPDAFASSDRSTGQWVSPVGLPLAVVAGFDPPAQRWLAGHRGVDLRAWAGQTVVAAGKGVVSFSGRVVDRGVVTISHGSLRTTYEPVDSAVVLGQVVSAGEFIGVLGTGGHCSERCLHWGLIESQTYLNPLRLLRSHPPVLKPVSDSDFEMLSQNEGGVAIDPRQRTTSHRAALPASAGAGLVIATGVRMRRRKIRRKP